MATRHRTDISAEDMKLLVCFTYALQVVFINNCSPVYVLGEVPMLLPYWFVSGDGWKLSSYKEVNQAAIGLSRNAMKHICEEYLHVPVKVMLDVLWRLAMVAVVPGTTVYDPPRFRMPFDGIPRDLSEWGYVERKHVREGFIIEQRRAEGGFRKGGGHGA
jgi:hypothetical protein